ncbi:MULTISPECIES: indolepyruvate ferredoxin oxidoreductase family protein [unclassified Haematospirillum]|uniref:indolepyruvate ferredoxin oxidoreductase family protein n=1 Tax=unclassified Haematospirillum TaxID=2622088 RepID=UPI00143C0DB3|nr:MULTISPECIES: indolepyruvate ferredoxin oxidoreductase family protein [unclassified Haematospirillum]NKD54402.1 indolepyruvate ferredoxin oxidoreductase family protein [Haematospirillum sp. H4890]NKD74445.1 indolepyruvate ferredoxin oxidoreductase family protein [Haematospirillum sp. H4485]
MGIDHRVTLEDKYAASSGRIYLSGIQALARIPMTRRILDLGNGLDTAGFISGYRGSPVGTLDTTLLAARKHLEKHHIVFQPGLNEDLAATAVWGSQQGAMFPGQRYDGVCGYWYGKGPGVDRSGDVFRHANMAGTSRHGGVVLFSGDDHAAKSSTVPSQTDYTYMDLQIPVLYPSNVQDILDYGVMAIQMSRYSGCWVALKCVSEVLDSSSTVEVNLGRYAFSDPEQGNMPEDGLHIRVPDSPLEQEYRLINYKIPAAVAFARYNRINFVSFASTAARIGIIAVGKSWLDTLQALDDMGIKENEAHSLGLRLFKVGMPWPLEPNGILSFARGLEHLVVIEEKRPVIETQIKELLYNQLRHNAPRITGKYSLAGEPAFQATGELGPDQIALVLGPILSSINPLASIKERLLFLERAKQKEPITVKRIPHFCAGCPHNTSTKVPEGSRAIGGIGCHYMVTWMDRSTSTFTQMGGEGVPWVGQAPFTEEKHVFANLGDGTYLHSGILAIRQAIAANVNITYRILFNDAVAMTGGQRFDGPLTVQSLAAQVAAEGVKRIAIVSDAPEVFRKVMPSLPPYTTLHHRDTLDELQRQLRQSPSVSVLIYEQTCAAEKRRRRKRGKMPDPDKRVFIHDLVCEGCGDCGSQSNCVAIEPLETEFGRKRKIDQSSCNKDFSCIKGFCPSFITVTGGKLRQRQGSAYLSHLECPPEPTIPTIELGSYDVVITGIGGTGVITISALLGMAAHLEGKTASVLDQVGLAQKNGAVISYLRIAQSPDHVHATRISPGKAHLVLGCDGLTAAGHDAILRMSFGHTSAVINTEETMTAEFTRNPDAVFPGTDIIQTIERTVGRERASFVKASELATTLMGDSLATNLFLIGYAWQKGLIPLSWESIMRAIELNGIRPEFNRMAFMWGRHTAIAPEKVASIASPYKAPAHHSLSEKLDDIISRRSVFLESWQDRHWANRYETSIKELRKAEEKLRNNSTALTAAAARSLFKLMSYKDEYEVARLYTDSSFMSNLKAQFEGKLKLTFYLAPPLLARRNRETGHLEKSAFGGWILPFMRVLARMRIIRGSCIDPFGYTPERKMQRQLITDFQTLLSEIASNLSTENLDTAVKLASLPLTMRGYGHILEDNVRKARRQQEHLLSEFRAKRHAMEAA